MGAAPWFETPYFARLLTMRPIYANPNSANASLWCSALSGAKQQKTTRVMPRGQPAISDATVPTAIRAARSAGKR